MRVCAHGQQHQPVQFGKSRVVTSIAAILSEADLQELVRRPARGPVSDEASPKRTPERGQGYSIGKVTLERMFTEAAEPAAAGTAFASVPQTMLAPFCPRIRRTKGHGNIEMMLLGIFRRWPIARG